MIIIIGGLLAAAYVFKVIGHGFTQAKITHDGKAVPLNMEWTARGTGIYSDYAGAFSHGCCVDGDRFAFWDVGY